MPSQGNHNSCSDIYPRRLIYSGCRILLSDGPASADLLSVLDLLQQCKFLLFNKLTTEIKELFFLYALLQALKYPSRKKLAPLTAGQSSSEPKSINIGDVITMSQLLSGSDVQTSSLMLQDQILLSLTRCSTLTAVFGEIQSKRNCEQVLWTVASKLESNQYPTSCWPGTTPAPRDPAED